MNTKTLPTELPATHGSARITLDDFNRKISSSLREKLTLEDMQEIVTIFERSDNKGCKGTGNPSPSQSGKLTITQLAARLGVHPLTIRRRVKSGEIKVLRMGAQIVRIEMSEVERIEAGLKHNDKGLATQPAPQMPE